MISAAYVTAMNLGYASDVAYSPSPLNPAIGASLILTQLFAGMWPLMNMTWVYCTFAFAGALLAIVCFEFIYKKNVPMNEADQEEFQEDAVEQEEQLVAPKMADEF